MKTWTTPASIRDRIQREWDRGRLLSSMLGGPSLFPHRITLSAPRSSEIVDRFDEVRKWISELDRKSARDPQKSYVLEWREINHRLVGKNDIPKTAVFETAEAALSFIGKEPEARRVMDAARQITRVFPVLKDWVVDHPLTVLEWADDWPRLLSVLDWVAKHPRSGLFLRQVDAPGIDTKFIETHRGVLGELLDIVLPSEAIDHEHTHAKGFEPRYGFRSKPQMVRFRFLDSDHSIQGLRDLTVPHDQFASLNVPVQRVFIVENEIEFLVFPEAFASLVIFGGGYSLKRLNEAKWLSKKEIYYWGDLDTHGLAILDELRAYFPHTVSVLMDEETLFPHKDFWEKEDRPTSRDLTRLTPAEKDLYEALRTNRWGTKIRLEQEKIRVSFMEEYLRRLGLISRNSLDTSM